MPPYISKTPPRKKFPHGEPQFYGSLLASLISSESLLNPHTHMLSFSNSYEECWRREPSTTSVGSLWGGVLGTSATWALLPEQAAEDGTHSMWLREEAPRAQTTASSNSSALPPGKELPIKEHGARSQFLLGTSWNNAGHAFFGGLWLMQMTFCRKQWDRPWQRAFKSKDWPKQESH